MSALFPLGSAVISDCGLYRYRLERELGGRRMIAVVMVNPSTADAETDDPTIRRVTGFARSWGFGRVVVVNLFAYRSADVRDLGKVEDPIGPENDAHILAAARESEMIVAAWGAKAKLPAALRMRADKVRDDLLSAWDLYCFRRTTGGEPEHPLFLPADLKPERYSVACQRYARREREAVR